METIYKLQGHIADIEARYNEISAELDEIYTENGGEVTEETEKAEALLAELETMAQEVVKEIIDNSDAYAEITLNKEAQRKVLEAELKAVKEEQKKAVARYEAKINYLKRGEDFWKENFLRAMDYADVTKIGGAKSKLLHSISIRNTQAVEVDEAILTEKYSERLREFQLGLPNYLTAELKVSKTELKKELEMPEGAVLVLNKSVTIR